MLSIHPHESDLRMFVNGALRPMSQGSEGIMLSDTEALKGIKFPKYVYVLILD